MAIRCWHGRSRGRRALRGTSVRPAPQRQVPLRAGLLHGVRRGSAREGRGPTACRGVACCARRGRGSGRARHSSRRLRPAQQRPRQPRLPHLQGACGGASRSGGPRESRVVGASRRDPPAQCRMAPQSRRPRMAPRARPSNDGRAATHRTHLRRMPAEVHVPRSRWAVSYVLAELCRSGPASRARGR